MEYTSSSKVDYYQVLGIPSTATDDDIKKAYKKGALANHPDRCPASQKVEAERKFQLISEAYEVLKDPQARSIYDRYGIDGLKNGGASSGNGGRGGGQWGGPSPMPGFMFHDPRSLFREFFGHDPFASAMFGGDPFARDPFSNTRDPFGHDPFGHPMGMGGGIGGFPGFGMMPGMGMMGMDPFGGHAGSSSSSFSSFSSSSSNSNLFGGGGGGFSSQSTRTTIVNGERTTVTTISDGRGNTRTETVRVGRDGRESREVVENGVKLVGGGESGNARGRIQQAPPQQPPQQPPLSSTPFNQVRQSRGGSGYY
ncbi:DnaJ sub B member 6 [Blyttiomyces sp. JEL0837]|nr:DnaJ sub B member 6 [Blyttiomyces sp. JEL0837]